MDAVRLDAADAFLAATDAYRASEPLRTNVMSSVAASVQDGAARFGEAFWWVVREGTTVLGAAMRTDPFPLNLGPMPDDAAATLAGAVAAADVTLPGATGFAGTVGAFLDAYRETGVPGASRRVATTQRQVLYVADAVELPAVPGELVTADPDDVGLAERWYTAFALELEGAVPARPTGGDPALRATLASGRLRWWRHDGTVVSMAGQAVPIASHEGVVTRVGPVYTPPEQRRRGYAAAVTGGLTAAILAAGSRAMLFADAANPTSNGVYQRLGYREVDVASRVELAHLPAR